MKSLVWKFSIALGAACLIGNLIASSSWAQNIARNQRIIDGSGAWPNEVFTNGSFPASRVTDGNKNESAADPETYWLGRDGDVTEYFTLDLGAPYNIDEIRLFNTHNRQHNDRMTDEFAIYAAEEVDAANQLVNPQPILSSNLSDVAGQTPIPADIFNSGNGLVTGTQARYLRFETLSAIAPRVNVGLNEIEVYDSSNLAAGKTIVAGSGAYAVEPFNGGAYPASAVVNGSSADLPGNYWLGREGVTNEHFILDLHNVEHIEEIRLFNTSNQIYDDRSTRNFRISASNSLLGNDLDTPQVILEGKLTNPAGLPSIPGDVFTAANGLTATDARYLKFEVIDSFFAANVGLGEIEVYATAQHSPTIRRENHAAGKPIIDGSGSWSGGDPCVGAPFNGGTFPAARVTDESSADANAVHASYWLGREYCSNEYFTIDLGSVVSVDEIELLNAHNTQYNDRGTDEFVIYAATEVDGLNQLVNPIPILSSNLLRTDGQTIITPETFTEANGLIPTQARYIMFQALSYHSSATNGSAGLNDIRIYSAVIPEPSSFALVVAGAATLIATRRRRAARP